MEEYGILFRADKQMYFAGFMDHGAPRWVDEEEDGVYTCKSQLDNLVNLLSTVFKVTTEIRGLS